MCQPTSLRKPLCIQVHTYSVTELTNITFLKIQEAPNSVKSYGSPIQFSKGQRTHNDNFLWFSFRNYTYICLCFTTMRMFQP